MRFDSVTVNGVTLHLAEAGPVDGPLLVLLHGFPEFWFGWRDYIEPLADLGFHVVAPDQRGYNLSGKPDRVDAYRLDILAADILGLADHYGSTRFQVVGHDWGGAVAWWIATTHPKRLLRMVVLNAPHPGVWMQAMRDDPEQRKKSAYVRVIRIPRVPEILIRLGRYAGLAKAFGSCVRTEAFSAETLSRYQAAWRQPGALTAMLNWYRALFRQAVELPGAGRIPVPTLVLWGDKDAYVRPDLAERSAALCAQAEVRHFGCASHWIAHDEPGDVLAALKGFLRV